MNKELLKYIPKEFKDLVTDIYEGRKELNEVTGRFCTPLIVEWENGETSVFQNKNFAFNCLKEFHGRDEFRRT